jgi:catalase
MPKTGGECTWKAMVQIMTLQQSQSYKWDPFDITKVWPREDFPMQEFGKLVLNKNPENFHRDQEQAAFNPGSLVPGIEVSNQH